jgi:hypothetical protein
VERVAHWKRRFEEAWRAGDHRAMAEAEEMLEAYRLKEQLDMEEAAAKQAG